MSECDECGGSGLGEPIEKLESPYAVMCHGGCGKVLLTSKEYHAQMSRPDALWRCPRCQESATWNDDHYEAAQARRICQNCDGAGVVGPACPGCGVVQDPGESTGLCESCFQARTNYGV